MTKLLTVVSGFSMVFGIGCMVGNEGEGTSGEDILGGVVDTGDPSVVAVRFFTSTGGLAGCTATVIAPTILLTAGHCADGFNFEYNASPKVDFGLGAPGWIAVASAHANPLYNGDASQGHDVAVLELETATSITPSSLGNAPAIGSTVKPVGYGITTFATSGPSGEKRQVDIAVNSVTATEFTAGSDGFGVCHGDSGGPTLQNGVVVGVSSYVGTADCHNSYHFMRVDNNRDFIDQYLGAGGGGGGGGGGGDLSTCIAACQGDTTCINACLGF